MKKILLLLGVVGVFATTTQIARASATVTVNSAHGSSYPNFYFTINYTVNSTTDSVKVRFFVQRPSLPDTLYSITTSPPGLTFHTDTVFMPSVLATYQVAVEIDSLNDSLIQRTGTTSVVVGQIVNPLDFANFTAKNVDGSIALSWQTYEERNTDHFTVSRKTSNEEDFSPLAPVAAVGNSNSIQTYTMTDVSESSGVIEYKLTEFDKDGSQNPYPYIIFVVTNTTSDNVQIIPKSQYVSMYSEKEVTVTLYTTTGIVVSSQTFSGTTEVPLTPQMYVAKIDWIGFPTKSVTTKVVVSN